MTEIKRKANAGERIKIVNANFTFGDYANGAEMVVEKRGGDRAVYVEDYGVHNGVRVIADYEYVVLEPDAEATPTTLIPDESLGGVLREYREVKRKANVGERIKVTAEMRFGERRAGEIHTVTGISSYGLVDTDGKWGDGSPLNLTADEYVVLEPSDVIRIDDADGVSRAYRMVDRKAAVGERVIITKGNVDKYSEAFRTGEIVTVHQRASFEGDGPSTSFLDGDRGSHGADYAVLEPLITADLAPTPTHLSTLPLVDQYAENITVLTRKIAQLEEGAKALEKRILALETDSAPACVDVASGSVDTSVLSALPSYAKSAQQIRDEIVERAKADVGDLRKFSGKQIPNDSVRFWPETKLPHAYISLHSVEFVVNSAKRTVVAIIRCTVDGMTTRGIAKCTPGETFNSALGKAIALYRALGLEVPAEYLTCPQPAEISVGDVVRGARPSGYYSADCRFTITSGNVGGTYKYAECPTDWIDAEQIGAIMDDSREDGGNSASPSALKGAA